MTEPGEPVEPPTAPASASPVEGPAAEATGTYVLSVPSIAASLEGAVARFESAEGRLEMVGGVVSGAFTYVYQDEMDGEPVRFVADARLVPAEVRLAAEGSLRFEATVEVDHRVEHPEDPSAFEMVIVVTGSIDVPAGIIELHQEAADRGGLRVRFERAEAEPARAASRTLAE